MSNYRPHFEVDERKVPQITKDYRAWLRAQKTPPTDEDRLQWLAQRFHQRWKQRMEVGDDLIFEDELILKDVIELLRKYLPLMRKLQRLLIILDEDKE